MQHLCISIMQQPSAYQATIDFLYQQLPMFSRLGAAAFKKDLTNTIKLCELLANPQKQFKSVHVAGTNGKGSVSHMLAAVFQKNGYKTGLYTSPHLHDFRERIKVNGEWISEAFVIDFVEKIKASLSEIQPSFFEITVAMAFDYFAQQKVDIAIIETGLGGRLDSTNVIIPELSVITNISEDHMDMLGDTLAKIAGEKAGIIKNNIPVVIGETHNETADVFINKAAEKAAPIVFADQLFEVTSHQVKDDQLFIDLADKNDQKTLQQYQLDLPGDYQQQNLKTVVAAVNQLRKNDWKLDDEAVINALANVKKLTGLHGRWEIIGHKPLIILDVAHNEAGLKQAIRQLQNTPHQNLHIVTGFVKDKDIDKALNVLPRNAQYYFCKADIPRALDAEILLEKAKTFDLAGNAFSTVQTAFEVAKAQARQNDVILVCGSCFIVGEIPEKST